MTLYYKDIMLIILTVHFIILPWGKLRGWNLGNMITLICGINKDIEEKEVKFVLKKARLKKAVGIDNIPFEVLRILCLYPFSESFFQNFLSHMWYQQSGIKLL